MKKILVLTGVLLFIPLIIVYISDSYSVDIIKLNYVHNMNIRVKRLSTDTVEIIPFEEYILGVLAGEMPVYFEKEALKAQAVAARSYALKRIGYNKDNDYDVVDSIINQVYLDREHLKEAWGKDYGININKIIECVNETSGQYLDYNGEIVDALFFSTSNGYTEDSQNIFNFSVPYLKSVESKWDSTVSSAFNSSVTISLFNFYEKMGLEYSNELLIEVLERSTTNRILSLKINNTIFKGTDIYNKLGLRSTDFVITKVGSNVVIETIGYGHGVGMSQYGAQGMALEGKNYKEILSYYYLDTTVKKY